MLILLHNRNVHYADKWGPSGTWTKAAKGTPKLESFFNQQDGSMQEGYQNILLDKETSSKFGKRFKRKF